MRMFTIVCLDLKHNLFLILGGMNPPLACLLNLYYSHPCPLIFIYWHQYPLFEESYLRASQNLTWFVNFSLAHSWGRHMFFPASNSGYQTHLFLWYLSSKESDVILNLWLSNYFESLYTSHVLELSCAAKNM